jgi:hypothetical protein
LQSAFTERFLGPTADGRAELDEPSEDLMRQKVAVSAVKRIDA